MGIKRALIELIEAVDKGVIPREVADIITRFILDHDSSVQSKEEPLIKVMENAVLAWNRARIKQGLSPETVLLPEIDEDM